MKCRTPSKTVLGIAFGVLVVGVSLGVPIHLVQMSQIEEVERDDFLGEVEIISQIFSLKTQDTLDVVSLVQRLSNQTTTGPPALTRQAFNSIFDLVIASFPAITSVSYSTFLLDVQLETLPCTPRPALGDTFLPNQTRFAVTTYLEDGLEDFECRDTYSSPGNPPIWDELIDGNAPAGSIINFNAARNEFSHFIVVPIPGSQNAIYPTLHGSFLSTVSPLPLLFESISTNPSIYVQVKVNDARIFETSPVIQGPSTLFTCRDIHLFLPDGSPLTTWSFCFQGDDGVFRRSQERRSIILISGFIGIISLGAICFGFYVDLAGQKRAEAAATSQRQIASWVCHDMRAPLARLDQKTMLGVVSSEDLRKEIQKMQAVVRNVLEIDRLVTGSFGVCPSQPFHFEEDWMDEFLQDMLLPQPLCLHLCVTPQVRPCVRVDRDRLAQILTNLLQNASKHSTTGEASLTFDMDNKLNLLVSIANPSTDPLPPPSTLYKPPPNYKDIKKIFAATPPPVLRSFMWKNSDPVHRLTKTIVLNSAPSDYLSVGWGLTIVKMLALGLGGDFFIDCKTGTVEAAFYLPSAAPRPAVWGTPSETHCAEDVKSEV